MKRKPMRKKFSKRNFRKGTKVNQRNIKRDKVYRGGYRI